MKHLYNEEQLIRQCIERKPAAQKELYTMYSAKMFGVCLRYMKNEADAKDLLHDGFIKVFDKLHLYHEGNLGAWMGRIFVNMALTQFRKNARGPMFTELEWDIADEKVAEVTVDASTDINKVLAAMQQLPDNYRTVLNLYAIDKLSHQEIADMLETTVSNTKSILSRARVKLKDLLK
jgi:RNA polymerase sigma factor (sigma-70 family)